VLHSNIDIPQDVVISFIDELLVSAWALDSVIAIQAAGIIQGRPGGNFDPLATATRAEVATIFSRFLPFV